MSVIPPWEMDDKYFFLCKICGRGKNYRHWHSVFKCEYCGNYNCNVTRDCEGCPHKSTECLLVDQKIKELL